MSQTSVLEAVKIQSRILIPIVRALEQELGKKRAHRIVGDAVAESYAQFKCSREPERDVHPGEGESGFPVETRVTEHTDDRFGFDVTQCDFADYFRSIGEPEIGALMTCGVDFRTEELLRPSWLFERTQTRMQGAEHCDFRWRKKATASGSQS